MAATLAARATTNRTVSVPQCLRPCEAAVCARGVAADTQSRWRECCEYKCHRCDPVFAHFSPWLIPSSASPAGCPASDALGCLKKMSIFQTYGRVLAEIGRDRVIMALLIAGNLAAAG
jgi:hypothetical protein